MIALRLERRGGLESMGDENGALRAEVEALRIRLAAADQQTCDFVSRLAHELRTPLGAILMWGHVLRMGRDADRDAALSAIEASARAQSAMIGRLLDVCRGAAGRLRIEPTSIDLCVPVREAVASLAQAAEARTIRLTASIGPAAVPVAADKTRVAEIVSILLDNAIKFTAPHGTVDVSTALHGNQARVLVRDSGRGLSPGDLGEIFVPFRSAVSATRPVSGGMGVGLALARQLAELHGGMLVAESAGVGHGSTFTLELPRQDAR
jgi:two-component system, chemotaxis family, CheB/CheR fusion protein